MPDIAQLRVTDYDNDNRWRWVLEDPRGKFLADHEVDLTDDTSEDAKAFQGLTEYLLYYREIKEPEQVLASLGAWMGERVFGAVAEKLAKHLTPPATVVRVSVPREAQGLLTKPFELAHLPGKDGGRPLAQAGVRFVYHLDDAPKEPKAKPTADAFRMLAVFSLPHGGNPLDLRRERVELEELIRIHAQTRGRSMELRVLQYGATRKILKDALEDSGGWDLIHISGHGREGELLLEDETGEPDVIGVGDLSGLLRLAQQRLHLLTLSTCRSGAPSIPAARRQIGLDPPAPETGSDSAEEAVTSEEDDAEDAASGDLAAGLPKAVPLPSLGQRLARELDCGVLAMRYSVGEGFAREMVLALYEKLLGKEQPLPAALQLALDEALGATDDSADARPLSRITPILFGPRAADLKLETPAAKASFALPETGLLGFPAPPPRFVGRVGPMLRASTALAPLSPHRGVLFHGMAGGGKTACALELAYRHEQNRFTGMAWWKAPDGGQEIAGALTDFALKLETQLPGLALVGLMDDPEDVRLKFVPRLRGLLQQRAILLVLDNLESLLTSKGGWRDERWGHLIPALLDHNGTSRVVLTSRRVPKKLAREERLQVEPIHALSFPESVLLARELPGLSQLLGTPKGRKRLRRVLAAAQGHPKLLELAAGVAQQDLDSVDKLVGGAAEGGEEGDEVRAGGRFFTEGKTDQDVAAFVEELESWTTGVSAGLPATTRLLFHFLCCLEEEDRFTPAVQFVWPRFVKRLEEDVPAALETFAEGGESLEAGWKRLAAAGLVEIEPLLQGLTGQGRGDTTNAEVTGAGPRVLRLHPAVAQAGRDEARGDVAATVDREMGDFWIMQYTGALKDEMQGAGWMIVLAGLRATPYLLRMKRWSEAVRLIEELLMRDGRVSTSAAVIPVLRRVIAADSRESESGRVILAMSLHKVGAVVEAEAILREVVSLQEAREDYQAASSVMSYLLSLLKATGRAEEGLQHAKRMVKFSRRANAGPWTQLMDEANRLSLLSSLGHYEEVLKEVQQLRAKMTALPKTVESNEWVHPWAVRELLLGVGRSVANHLGHWATALRFNAEKLTSMKARVATLIELTEARFDDYFPLLRLGRLEDARDLLTDCRDVFETYGEVGLLGKVLNALADLENIEGNYAEAVRFQHAALRHKYQAGDPEPCAVSHLNLANSLENRGGAATAVLAHRIAAGLIWLQFGSGDIRLAIHELGRSKLPSDPPEFDKMVAEVEEVEGVRFRLLLAGLPQRAPGEDQVLAELWRLARREQDEFFRQIDDVPQLLARLARCYPSIPEEVEETLAQLEEGGWHLTDAVHRIWEGERDAEALTTEADPRSARLIRRILELVEQPTYEEALAAAPAPVREAIEADDLEALKAAVEALPEEEAGRVVQSLHEAGVLESG